MAEKATKPEKGSQSEQDLSFYLVTRFLFVLAAVLAAEGGVLWLETSTLIPWIQSQIGDSLAIIQVTTLHEMCEWIVELALTTFHPKYAGTIGLAGKSLLLGTLVFTLALVLLPIVLGALVFAFLVTRRVRSLMREQKAEHDRADKRRSLFITDIAHDLRTPIMAISGMSHAMMDGIIPNAQTQQEYQRAICEKSDKLGELINLVFDYSKLGSEGFRLEREYLDLSQLLLQEAGQIYSDAEDAGMIFEVMVPEQRCTVFADATQLRRLVGNLLANAISHNPKGTVIVLYLARKAGTAMVYVADTGVVIEGDVNQLFQPFTRGDAARSSSGGTGLGLSISHRIAEMHDYELSLIQPCRPYTKSFVLQCSVED